MSDPTNGPPPPDSGPPRPVGGVGVDALEVTVRVGDRAIGSWVNRREGELLAGTPVPLTAHREGSRWRVDGPDGAWLLGARDTVEVRRGEVEVRVVPVRQARFARLHLEQGDAVLPVLVLVVTVAVLQLGWIYSLLFAAPEGGAGGFEPTPEYIARLLREDYDGSERGVVAPPSSRPATGEAIENYYLQPGHDGPRDRIGGGRNIGERVADGQKDGEQRRRRAPVLAPPAAGGDAPPVEAPPVADAADAAEAPADGEAEEGDDAPIAVHVDEGWGLTDWYDTKDAREDAKAIEDQLKLAREVLRLDPDDPGGLTTRAYYEYLAFDFEAAKRTYSRFTTLYPDDPAGWNNLALVYKREGDYAREEALYRIAADLDPNDDHVINNLAVCLAHQGRYDEALALMERLEVLTPDDPYADLHRAKIHAAMGKDDRAYHFLQKSLAAMRRLDTLHNIEFRQDIRVDPAFATLREQPRFRALLDRFYGERARGWWNQRKEEGPG